MSADTTKAAGHSHQRRGLLITVVVIVVLVALVVFHLLTGKREKTGTPAQVVSAATATLGSMPEILSELGTVTPVATVNVLDAVRHFTPERVARAEHLVLPALACWLIERRESGG